MSYDFLQQYWWFLVSLLGALLVFMMFVQGANSVLFSLGGNDSERQMIINSTGKKWELTFTTLVTFGGAFFASFPLFYSTSFGGAYWLWMITAGRKLRVPGQARQPARGAHVPVVSRHQRHRRPAAARRGRGHVLQRGELRRRERQHH